MPVTTPNLPNTRGTDRQSRARRVHQPRGSGGTGAAGSPVRSAHARATDDDGSPERTLKSIGLAGDRSGAGGESFPAGWMSAALGPGVSIFKKTDPPRTLRLRHGGRRLARADLRWTCGDVELYP